MDPITLGAIVGVNALSGLAQAYVAMKAQGASKAALDKAQAAFDAIKPADYDINISTW